MEDELHRLEEMDKEFIEKVDQFLETQSRARLTGPGAIQKLEKAAKPREVGFIYRAFADKVLAHMTLGMMSALTVGIPFLLYHLTDGMQSADRGFITFWGTTILGVIPNITFWGAEWPLSFLNDVWRGLRHRHYLKVAKTLPEATIYDIIALSGEGIAEQYPDCNIVRLQSDQFLRLKPIYAKIFSGKSKLDLDHILNYMKNILRVKDSFRGIDPNA